MRYVIPVSKVKCAICGVLYDAKHSDGIRAAGRLFAKLQLPPKAGGFLRINGKAFAAGSAMITGGLHEGKMHYHKWDVWLAPLFEHDGEYAHPTLVITAPTSDGNALIVLEKRMYEEMRVRSVAEPVEHISFRPRLSRKERLRMPARLLKGIPALSRDYRQVSVEGIASLLNSPRELDRLFTRKLKKNDMRNICQALKKLGVI